MLLAALALQILEALRAQATSGFLRGEEASSLSWEFDGGMPGGDPQAPVVFAGWSCAFAEWRCCPADGLTRAFQVGADLVSQVPLLRWDVDEHYDPPTSTPKVESS